jgi:2'-5' RNA ligase
MDGMAFSVGETAVIVAVPAVEALVRPWRERHDSSAPWGVPAHVTLLYPFLPSSRLGASTVDRLAALCARQPAFDVSFRRCARFPGVLYLAPEPAGPFRRITAAITEQWPDHQPYGGVHDDVVPHLTIADSADDETLATVENVVSPGLPVSTRVREAWLLAFDGTRWNAQTRLPFAGSAA